MSHSPGLLRQHRPSPRLKPWGAGHHHTSARHAQPTPLQPVSGLSPQLETLHEQPSQLTFRATGEDPDRQRSPAKLYNFKQLIYKRGNNTPATAKLPSISGAEPAALLSNLTVFSYDTAKDNIKMPKNLDIYNELENKRYFEPQSAQNQRATAPVDQQRAVSHSPILPPSRIPEIVRFARNHSPERQQHLKASFKLTPKKNRLAKIEKIPLIERRSSGVTPADSRTDSESSPRYISPPALELSKVGEVAGGGSRLARTSRRASSLVAERSKKSINQAFNTFTNFNKLLHGRVNKPMVAPVPYAFGIQFKNLSEKVRYEKQLVEIMKLKHLITSEPNSAGQHLLEFLTLHLSPDEFAQSITPEKIILLTRAVQLFQGMPPSLSTHQFIFKAFSGEIAQFSKIPMALDTSLTPIASKRTTRYSRFDTENPNSLTYTSTFEFKGGQSGGGMDTSTGELTDRGPSPSEPGHYKITQQHRKKRLPSSTLEPNRLEFVLGRYITKTAKIKTGEILQPAVDKRPKHHVGRMSNAISSEIERLNTSQFKRVHEEQMERGVMKRNKLLLEHVMHQRSKSKNIASLHSAYFQHLRTLPATAEILEEQHD